MGKPKTSKKLRPSNKARDETPDSARDIAAELAGSLKGSKIGDPREEYTEYLRKKYS